MTTVSARLIYHLVVICIILLVHLPWYSMFLVIGMAHPSVLVNVGNRAN